MSAETQASLFFISSQMMIQERHANALDALLHNLCNNNRRSNSIVTCLHQVFDSHHKVSSLVAPAQGRIYESGQEGDVQNIVKLHCEVKQKNPLLMIVLGDRGGQLHKRKCSIGQTHLQQLWGACKILDVHPELLPSSHTHCECQMYVPLFSMGW